MKILINNIKNHKYFDLKYINNLCVEVNKNTKLIEFSPVKVDSSEYGLRYVTIRTKYKDSKNNSSCKLILSENSKGELKVYSRKGFIISFIPDIELFQRILNKKVGQ
jgi:hypothetical protein